MTAVLGANIGGRARVGAHLCAVFTSATRRDEILTGYFSGRSGERQLYLRAPEAPGLPEELRAHVTERDAAEMYLGDGTFDGAAVVEGFRDEIASTLRDGYRRLRVAADMGWARGSATTPDALVAYESAVNGLLAEGGATGMCLYDTARFDGPVLDRLAEVHPFVAAEQPSARPMAFTATREPDGALRLRGELDYFSAGHLVALLQDMAGGDGDMILDVRDVAFMDAAALAALETAAGALRDSPRVVLRDPSRVVRRLLALLPRGTGATVTATTEPD